MGNIPSPLDACKHPTRAGAQTPKTGNGEACKSRRVRLAVTPIGPLLPTFQAYHTSVCVGDKEFTFDNRGIRVNSGQGSHRNFIRGDSVLVLDLGFTTASTKCLQTALQPFFLPGTYDFLRKNCNSFTDCALFYLLGERLNDMYRAPEKLGAQWDDYVGAVQNFTVGRYRPNPRAAGFSTCQVISEIQNFSRQPRPAAGPAEADAMKEPYVKVPHTRRNSRQGPQAAMTNFVAATKHEAMNMKKFVAATRHGAANMRKNFASSRRIKAAAKKVRVPAFLPQNFAFPRR
mmetsp:Transcript_109978/g.311212  ORF Transcript_109978/g.311212 Transcript_109978/m.311212 type:complete len:288 (-) Transcript_109978:120-983(-)|eukprot:CAMPEP_0179234894 /NCGR_PEP_ID=MMETSP0797-20121207/13125_1 /TAXON_ID=47934 /ORGANISM="Dinophysis acuminata, Strain DAEP01" /LENGTH=287 /DNA_ID=CAMNT_0020942089 /DNA_START=86 /DNA_END=949 /DNA_ORIENTATION=+